MILMIMIDFSWQATLLSAIQYIMYIMYNRHDHDDGHPWNDSFSFATNLSISWLMFWLVNCNNHDYDINVSLTGAL